MRGDLLELHHPLGIGLLMDAEYGGDGGLLQVRRHGFIRREHEFLDQPVRDVARATGDAGHFAKFVEFDQRLRHVEIDGAAPDALLVQHQRQFPHQFEARDERRVSLAESGVAFQQGMHGGVSHPFHAANDSPAKLLRDDIAAPVNLQFHRKHQPIDSGFQRADFGGELQRQHRNGAIRKIDAGAAQESFFIDRAARFYVMADIGYVHLQCIIAVRQTIHPNRVIEIPRRLAVDGYYVQRPIILAPGHFILANDVRKALSLLQNLRWKMMRDVMLPDHDLDIHAEIVRASEDLDNTPHGLAAILGKLQNLHVDDHAIQVFGRLHFHWRYAYAIATQHGGGLFHPFRNLDPLPDALVMRRHKVTALAYAKLADHGLVSAPQHLDDLAIRTAIPLDTRNANHHSVTMHGGLRRFTRDIDVTAQALDGMVGNQEAVTVAVHVQAADCIFAAQSRDYKMAGPNFNELSPLDQPIQRTLQFIARCKFRAQFANQLLE